MLQKSNTWKVLEVFFDNPDKQHYLIDIARKIGLAHTSVKKILDDLIKEKLIIKSVEKKGRRNFPLYKANISEKNFKIYKRAKLGVSILVFALDIEFIDILKVKKNGLLERNR